MAAKVDYVVPGPTSTPAQIEAVARRIERRVTRTYGELVANTSGSDRRWAISALDAAAAREIAFGIPPSHFPGSADYFALSGGCANAARTPRSGAA